MVAFFNQDFSAFENDFFQRLAAFKNYQALSRGGYLYEELREVQLPSGEKICLNSLCPWHPRFAEYCNSALNKLTVESPEGMNVIETFLPKGVELCVTLDQSIKDGSLLSPFEGRGSTVSIEAPSVSPETRDSSSSSASRGSAECSPGSDDKRSRLFDEQPFKFGRLPKYIIAWGLCFNLWSGYYVYHKHSLTMH
jgi:hypothetical protein